MVEALGVENDRCILVLAPYEPVSGGHGIVAAFAEAKSGQS